MTKDEIRGQISHVECSAADGITYFYTEGCTLTNDQKSDIEAANIFSKWAIQLPLYLDECAALRAADPTMADIVVRALARTNFQTGV